MHSLLKAKSNIIKKKKQSGDESKVLSALLIELGDLLFVF